MKINFLLLTLITAAISSCSSSYRTGQTPDDVYYSPLRLETNDVRRDRETSNDNSVYNSPYDNDIRRRVRNGRYRRYDDRYNYPYGTTYGPGYSNPKFGIPQNTSEPRKTNLGAYAPNSSAADSVKTSNPKLGTQNNATTTAPVRTFDTPKSTQQNKGVGDFIRKVLTSGNNSNNNTNSHNNHTSPRTFDNNTNYNNSNNNSSAGKTTPSTSSESKSSSAPVRTFGKN